MCDTVVDLWRLSDATQGNVSNYKMKQRENKLHWRQKISKSLNTSLTFTTLQEYKHLAKYQRMTLLNFNLLFLNTVLCHMFLSDAFLQPNRLYSCQKTCGCTGCSRDMARYNFFTPVTNTNTARWRIFRYRYQS